MLLEIAVWHMRQKPQLSEAKLSRSLEDYLRAIYVICRRKRVARVRDIARLLKVKPSSVTYSLKKLSKMGLVEYEKHGYVILTEEGLKVAEGLSGRFHVIENFLVSVLGVPPEIAEADACSLEHFLNKETVDRLKKFIEFISKNPEGANLIRKFQKYFSETSNKASA